MRYVGYVRVSRVMGREGESFISPQDQRQRIEAWAKANGHEIIEFYEDHDASGGTMDRPQFALAMAMLEAKDADGLVVAYLSRFARSLTGALDALEAMESWGAKFASVADSFDTSTSTGRFVLNVLLSMAQLERDRITENWAAAVGNAVARGASPNTAPFGYSKDASKRLYANDDAPYVKGIFERRLRGDTWASIAAWLNLEGRTPKRGGQWTGQGVKDVIRNETYLGVIARMGFRNESAHEPLIGKADWLAAQNINGIEQSSNPDGQGQLLSGLMRCAGCSYTLRASSYGRKGQQTRQYSCKGHYGSGDCPAPASVNASTVEPWVMDRFFEYVADVRVHASQDAPELAAAEQAVEDAGANLSAFRDDPEILGVLGRDSFLEGLRSRVSALETAAKVLDDARKALNGVDLPDEATLKTIWPDLTITERRRLLASAIDAIFVRRGARGDMDNRAKVLWRGEAAALTLSRKGRSVPITRYDW